MGVIVLLSWFLTQIKEAEVYFNDKVTSFNKVKQVNKIYVQIMKS